ncbi:CCA tRNA nucleotidyltransferase, mitochondrial [Myotisia sp. PD_48]|nr:CCA tRNA nucleotidyltransferase, mitochondrial [Myotisia sp. PD_48]
MLVSAFLRPRRCYCYELLSLKPLKLPLTFRSQYQQNRMRSAITLPLDHLESPRKRQRTVQTSTIRATIPSGIENKPDSMEDNLANLPRLQLTRGEKLLQLLLLNTVKYIREHRTRPVKEDIENNDLILRFSGGWVRDKIMGADSHDIDVGISSMTGYQFGLELQKYLQNPNTLEEYNQLYPDYASTEIIGGLHKIAANPEKSKHLETTTIRIVGYDVDLVNLRKETYTEDSRNPQIEYGTAEEDALRRDATINSLFYNLHTNQVEDFTGRGLQDMELKILRTPLGPHQTFKDDPLRVLRLIRFASRFGYQIDPEAAACMGEDDIKFSLKKKISPERILKEVEKMLRGPDPLCALRIIYDRGLYDTIFANHHDEEGVDASSWPLAYNSVYALLNDADQKYTRDILARDSEEEFYAWIVTALSPWSRVTAKLADPMPKKPLPRSALVARDSIKCPNRIIAILATASTHQQLIADIIGKFADGMLGSSLADTRWEFASLLRKLGSDWRPCFIQSMLIQIMEGKERDSGKLYRWFLYMPPNSKTVPQILTCPLVLAVFKNFHNALRFLEQENLLGVVDLRPLINGHTIAKALNKTPGPWMANAMEIIVEWQIRNPDRTDVNEALEEVKKKI